jgi:hypothetical protein
MDSRVLGAAAGAAALVAVAVTQVPPTAMPVLGPDCTLTAGEQVTGLSREQARALTAAASDPALTTPGALTCRSGRPEPLAEVEGSGGLTPRAERLRAEVEAVFGPQSLGGFAPGGVREGHIEGSAHYEGRALDLFFRPVTPEGKARGWLLSHWLVAHADELDVTTVIFDRQVWSAGRSRQGWRPYQHPSGDTENPVLAHEDHVHVDVAR